MQTVNDQLNMSVVAQPVTTPCARLSSWKRKLSVSTPRSWPTGHSSLAETLPHHCFTYSSAWEVWELAPRFNDTPQAHGQPGSGGHSHPNGSHRLTGCGVPVCGHAHPTHPRPPSEHNLPPPQATGLGPAHPRHARNTCQRHPTHPAQTTRGHPRQQSHPESRRSIPPTAEQRSPHEADDRCFQVPWLVAYAHPAASDPANISPTCPNVSAELSEFAPAPSMPINSAVSCARVGARPPAPFRACQVSGRPGHHTNGRQGLH